MAILHTFQFTVTHAVGFSVFTSLIPLQRIYHSFPVTSNHTWSQFAPPNSFLAHILWLSIPRTRLHSVPSSYPGRLASRSSTLHFRLDYCTVLCCRTLLYNHFARTPEKTPSFIVNKLCLLIPCLAVDVLLLSEFAFAGMCLPSRCLAMGIHVTLWFPVLFRDRISYPPVWLRKTTVRLRHIGCLTPEGEWQSITMKRSYMWPTF
jgi:hypothetical protein